jgi:hypothetical protein
VWGQVQGKNSQKQTPQKKYSGQQWKEMDCDEPHLTSNDKI